MFFFNYKLLQSSMTNNSKEIILIGYSGHALTVIDAISSLNFEVNSYFDLKSNSNCLFDFEYLGDEKNFDFNKLKSNQYLFPAIGENSIRKKIVEFIESKKLKELLLIHQNAYIGLKTKIGNSSLVAAGVLINCASVIGKGCILNTGCIIEHEAEIGDFVHIGPGATLAGNVSIGELSFIGANSTIKQGIRIGKNCIIGAGSVVLKDIPNDSIFVGNPAKFLRKND